MRSSRRTTIAATVLALGLWAAPATAQSPSPDAPGTSASAVGAIAGLYGDAEVLVTGTPDHARVISALDCRAVREVLEAGDWRVDGSFTQKGKKGSGLSLAWLHLVRGEDQAFVTLRGAKGACLGEVTRTDPRPFVATGATDIASTAAFYPQLCVALDDGTIGARGWFDIAGGWLASAEVSAVAVPGTRPLTADMLGSSDLTLVRTGKPLFAALNDKKAQARLSGGDLTIGPRFGGSVTVISVDPFEARVSMTGLQDARGRQQGLELTFACHPDPGLPSPEVAAPDQVRVDLSVRDTLDAGRLTGSSDQTVTLDGVLELVTPTRYEGRLVATGVGSFKEARASGSGRCTGRWTGTQPVDVVGVVREGSLELVFRPAGTPELTWESPCNPASHAGEETFPWGTAMTSAVAVGWPPDAADDGRQTVRNVTKGIGGTVWEVAVDPVSTP